MELSQLRYFLTAARHEHMTNAARELHIAQPALTKSIHRLEEELGVPLFYASGRNIKLTSYGSYLMTRMEPLLAEIQSVPSDIRQMAEKENTTIHMNVSSASMIIMDTIVSYKRIHPTVHFQVFQSDSNQLCDIRITARRSQRNQQIVNTGSQTYIFPERIFLAVPLSPKYADLTEIPLSMVKNEGFASLAGSKALRLITDQICDESGFSPQIVFESENPVAVRNFIEAGLGIGFWPEFSWGPCKSDELMLLPIQHPNCQRDILISCNNHKIDDSEVRKYYAYIIQQLESLVN